MEKHRLWICPSVEPIPRAKRSRHPTARTTLITRIVVVERKTDAEKKQRAGFYPVVTLNDGTIEAWGRCRKFALALSFLSSVIHTLYEEDPGEHVVFSMTEDEYDEERRTHSRTASQKATLPDVRSGSALPQGNGSLGASRRIRESSSSGVRSQGSVPLRIGMDPGEEA